MVDREKVIKSLEYCEKYFNCCDKCPYWDDGIHCVANLAHDALALLKEQEADEPKQVGVYGKEVWYGLVYTCPYCNAAWMGDRIETHFCPECGKAVKCDG